MFVKILIPIYKSALTDREKESFLQCLHVLKAYPICLVAPESLNTSLYMTLSKACNVNLTISHFNHKYFENVYAYSQLLLNRNFYQHFKDCDYILIYQLDGFVFRDELNAWCKKGYDYIGAPWFKNYGSNENGDKLWKVGNGGVSLRRVSAFLNIFDRTMPFSIYPFYVKNIRKKGFFTMSINVIKMLYSLLFRNKSVEYYLQNFTDERINEDCFWTDGLSMTKLALHIPDTLTAARFCIEKSPSYLYQLTGNKLPFSCHAYEKYEYDNFWQEKIKSTKK